MPPLLIVPLPIVPPVPLPIDEPERLRCEWLRLWLDDMLPLDPEPVVVPMSIDEPPIDELSPIVVPGFVVPVDCGVAPVPAVPGALPPPAICAVAAVASSAAAAMVMVIIVFIVCLLEAKLLDTFAKVCRVDRHCGVVTVPTAPLPAGAAVVPIGGVTPVAGCGSVGTVAVPTGRGMPVALLVPGMGVDPAGVYGVGTAPAGAVPGDAI